ncbi:hypothetical protein EVAR_36429_1 [Eumeta japonica]|uniref:Sushi domain-containing protein n=1 Tax=Eumeta variegata TaxID=151549 RepID=A0A4C1VPV7_EUMVA|nr:hypothetical protein EVAR_36429_1 [Eumeta japonica]
MDRRYVKVTAHGVILLPKCLAPCVVPHVSQGKIVLVENKTRDNETTEGTTQIVGSSSMVQHGELILVDCENNYEFPSNNAAVSCNNGTWTQIPRCLPARNAPLCRKGSGGDPDRALKGAVHSIPGIKLARPHSTSRRNGTPLTPLRWNMSSIRVEPCGACCAQFSDRTYRSEAKLPCIRATSVPCSRTLLQQGTHSAPHRKRAARAGWYDLNDVIARDLYIETVEEFIQRIAFRIYDIANQGLY